MLNLVSQDGVPNVCGIFFVVEFRRMHANHDQLVPVLFFEVFQVGKDMHAVDAAVSPEVQQHHLSLQFGEVDGPRGVHPFAATIQNPWRDFYCFRKWIFRRLGGGLVCTSRGRCCLCLHCHCGRRDSLCQDDGNTEQQELRNTSHESRSGGTEETLMSQSGGQDNADGLNLRCCGGFGLWRRIRVRFDSRGDHGDD